ncbi:MAG TPA: radical SAM protein [Candidatus Margulisiibacteriota bacterium]|nr:radical SAM protein [Candidatus Margulisiibacteriota bacterium]
MNIVNQAKKFIHLTGQIFLRPIWNFLPNVQLQLCLGMVTAKVCNADCVFCAYQFLPVSERTFMPDEIFQLAVKGIRELSMPLQCVHFTSNSGEPLLNKKFLEWARSLREAGVKEIRLTTNGINIDSFGADALLDEVDEIIISTTPFSEEMYRRIYRSGQFERMRNNVFSLLEANKKRKSKRLISLLLHSDLPVKETRQIPETRKLMELADEVDICIGHGDWLGLIKQEMLPGKMYIEKPKPLSRRPCLFLLASPAIYPNGDISACTCRNINNDPEMFLGNIKEVSLDTAMRNLIAVSAKWRGGSIPATCHRCTMYADPSYYWPDYFRMLLSGSLSRR